MRQYLHFAHRIEQAIVGYITPPIEPIERDPQLISYRAQLADNPELSPSQYNMVQQNYRQRRQVLAKHLEVPATQLDDLLAQFLNFRTLELELHNIKHPDNRQPVSSDHQLICDNHCQLQFEADELMRIAQAADIDPWLTYRVNFTESERQGESALYLYSPRVGAIRIRTIKLPSGSVNPSGSAPAQVSMDQDSLR